MEQRKTESIKQFAGQVEQRFKRLRALYPGRYDCNQLKERVFQGMYPHLRDSIRFLYMKEEVGYEEFLAMVYEAETEGTEEKVLNVKAKAMTVEKVVEKKVSSPKKKEVYWNSPKKVFQGSPRKGKGISKPEQKPIKCYRCDGWGHGWKECPTPENLNWRELVGAVVPSNPEGSGSIPTLNTGCSQWFQKH